MCLYTCKYIKGKVSLWLLEVGDYSRWGRVSTIQTTRSVPTVSWLVAAGKADVQALPTGKRRFTAVVTRPTPAISFCFQPDLLTELSMTFSLLSTTSQPAAAYHLPQAHSGSESQTLYASLQTAPPFNKLKSLFRVFFCRNSHFAASQTSVEVGPLVTRCISITHWLSKCVDLVNILSVL